jgi:hypothetical protein
MYEVHFAAFFNKTMSFIHGVYLSSARLISFFLHPGLFPNLLRWCVTFFRIDPDRSGFLIRLQ